MEGPLEEGVAQKAPDETAEELSSQLVKQGRANVPVTPDEVVTNA